ncbi:hypothetical protein [Rhizobium sp. NZLR1b]|uniref:hypothetical protein n=1 Tax=Rhizobium sp. NZLR1b TaxID=2731099 RepID=UPI001C831E12|nr:hypothetical protein [Rhizobium sp. NZLR1b]
MFFTRVGKIIAHLIFWLGIFRVGIGVVVAFGTPDMESNAHASRIFLAAATSGEAINEGSIGILLAVAIGVLCEISSKSQV